MFFVWLSSLLNYAVRRVFLDQQQQPRSVSSESLLVRLYLRICFDSEWQLLLWQWRSSPLCYANHYFWNFCGNVRVCDFASLPLTHYYICQDVSHNFKIVIVFGWWIHASCLSLFSTSSCFQNERKTVIRIMAMSAFVGIIDRTRMPHQKPFSYIRFPFRLSLSSIVTHIQKWLRVWKGKRTQLDLMTIVENIQYDDEYEWMFGEAVALNTHNY